MDISELRVSVNGDKAQARFKQILRIRRADQLPDHKTLDLVRSANGQVVDQAGVRGRMTMVTKDALFRVETGAETRRQKRGPSANPGGARAASRGRYPRSRRRRPVRHAPNCTGFRRCRPRCRRLTHRTTAGVRRSTLAADRVVWRPRMELMAYTRQRRTRWHPRDRP